jgi:hypothetical protein
MAMTHSRPRDQIIEEVHLNREQLLRDAGGSIDALCDSLRKLERAEQRPVVKLPLRPLTDPGADAARFRSTVDSTASPTNYSVD